MIEFLIQATLGGFAILCLIQAKKAFDSYIEEWQRNQRSEDPEYRKEMFDEINRQTAVIGESHESR